jgi:hypothetical protein
VPTLAIQYPIYTIRDLLSFYGGPNRNNFTGQKDVDRLRGHELILPLDPPREKMGILKLI